jgi:hypothetical protein
MSVPSANISDANIRDLNELYKNVILYRESVRMSDSDSMSLFSGASGTTMDSSIGEIVSHAVTYEDVIAAKLIIINDMTEAKRLVTIIERRLNSSAPEIE